MTVRQYDAIIIGSGQAGTPLSTALAQAGMHTALVERVHVGGTCVNEGCTPTKTTARRLSKSLLKTALSKRFRRT